MCVKTLALSPGEEVVKRGEYGAKLFIVITGKIEIFRRGVRIHKARLPQVPHFARHIVGRTSESTNRQKPDSAR